MFLFLTGYLMKLKLSMLILAMVSLFHPSLHAESLLDTAAQLIPQDPKHPVMALVQNDILTAPTPPLEKKPEISGTSASGETQAAIMDQNGRWAVTEKPSPANRTAVAPKPTVKTTTMQPALGTVSAVPTPAQPVQVRPQVIPVPTSLTQPTSRPVMKTTTTTAPVVEQPIASPAAPVAASATSSQVPSSAPIPQPTPPKTPLRVAPSLQQPTPAKPAVVPTPSETVKPEIESPLPIVDPGLAPPTPPEKK